ncbi:hypothetical protein J7E29_02150 [Streptomyces sp. ISL-90]|nr:hypothetical protein [Streptomyces sp. ISL-90]
MEHTQNTRKFLAAGLVLVAATVGLAGCATASPAADPGLHRMLVRESADRYVDELIERANLDSTHRMLVRESADRYVDELIERANLDSTHRMLVRESADRYVDELIERANAAR